MNELKVLGIPELSKLSGMSQFSIRQLCKSGRLPFLDMGNKWLIRLEDFKKLFECEVQKKDD